MSNGTQKVAKFGVVVVRWRDGKRGWERWEEHISFLADPTLEGTDALLTHAEGIIGKKWKKDHTRGWDIVETWMEPPRCW